MIHVYTDMNEEDNLKNKGKPNNIVSTTNPLVIKIVYNKLSHVSKPNKK